MKAHGKVIQDTRRRIEAREHCIAILQDEVAALSKSIEAIQDAAKNKTPLTFRDYVVLLSPMTSRERSALTRMLTMYKALPFDVDNEGARKLAELERCVEFVTVKDSLAALADDGVTITEYQGRPVVRARDGKIIHTIDDAGPLRGRGNPAAKFETRDGPTQHRVGSHPSSTARNVSRITAADDAMPSPTSGWTEEQWAAADALIMGWEPEPGTED